MEIKKTSITSPIFFCEKCDFKCYKKGDYTRHLMTRKHNMEINGKERKSEKLCCNSCNKTFKTESGLWKHAKKCMGNSKNKLQEGENTNLSDISNVITPELVMTLLTQNQEFKQLIIEQQQENREQQKTIIEQQEENQKIQNKLLEAVNEGKHITNNTNCNNTNKFNLNFFLNEQCKNAMNISEFIDNMVLSVEDLKNTGKLGYIDGITKIFNDKLKELDTHNRPMHCTDLKRETLYIKNNNEWDKDSDKNKMKTAIECVANKNLNNLNHWKEENPNHVIMDSNEDKEFVEIMTNSLGGMGSDREKNKQRIIKNVLKEVIVDK